MRKISCCVVMACGLAAGAGAHARAQTLLDTCHASSSYDITIGAGGVLFDRTRTSPQRVHLHDGQLRLDGTPVDLDAADGQRVAQIEHTVRTLEPRVKAIATRGVDLAAQAVREQAAASAPASSAELDARIGTIANELKQRIARSDSSHDWHGPAFREYANDVMARIVPLLAAGMLKQAVAAALGGDFDAAAQLRAQAADLASALRARIRVKLQALRPQVQALCPALRRIDTLESGIRTSLPGGNRLNLIDIGGD